MPGSIPLFPNTSSQRVAQLSKSVFMTLYLVKQKGALTFRSTHEEGFKCQKSPAYVRKSYEGRGM
jgi:hypothetical protein